MTQDTALTALRDAVADLILDRPDILAFCGPVPEETPFRPQRPQGQPVQTHIAALPSDAPVVAALQVASPFLRWNLTYDAHEVGADFLTRYGWVDVIGPRGPFVWETIRVMIGFWDQGLDYPEHWHSAEELYVPLYGAGEFTGESYGTRVVGVGESQAHGSNEVHASRTPDAPLLALAVWRGDDLVVSPSIKGLSGSVTTATEPL